MIFVVRSVSAQQFSAKDSTGKGFKLAAFKLQLGAYAPVYPHFYLSPDFSVKNLSFFCRQEWRLEKVTKIPFKFRLGSLQYVDWLEGKPNSNSFPR